MSTRYNWHRLKGEVTFNIEGYKTTLHTENRRKEDGDKLSAKGRGKGSRLARFQAIADKQPESFMKQAAKVSRASNQREARRAKR